MPSNDGRGYVLRRIIRRAIRHGYKLGQKGLFFHRLVTDLVAEMGDAYPELRAKQALIEDELKKEEIKFAETLDKGMALLEEALKDGVQVLDGKTAFQLYDTYGFPLDLTADICRERDLQVDQDGFDAAMEAQRAQSRAASTFKMGGKLEYAGDDTRFEAMPNRPPKAAFSRCTRTASRSTPSPPATAAWWCWTARRSTPKAVARSVIPARWPPPADWMPCLTYWIPRK